MRFTRFAPSTRRPQRQQALERSGLRYPCAYVLLAAAFLSAAPGPAAQQATRAIPLESLRHIPRYPLHVVADYEWGLATVVSVLEEELGFPRLDTKVLLLPDRAALAESLAREGHSSESGSIAQALGAVCSADAVRIDRRAMLPLKWPARLQVLAHELTHAAENQLSGGGRGTSEQWLREGLAVWASVRTLEVLGHGRLTVALRDAREAVVRGGRKRHTPRLAELVTPASWSGSASGRPVGLLYDQSLLAAHSLIQAHGLRSVFDYFRRFATGSDRNANFLAVFNETPEAFEARFDADLAQTLR